MKKSFLCTFLMLLLTFNIFAATNKESRIVVIVSADKSMDESEKAFLPVIIKSTFKERLRTYTNFEIVDIDNQEQIFALQARSEGEAFDTDTAIEIGKIANANYGFFINISKPAEQYLLTADVTNLTNGFSKANSFSTRETADDVFSNKNSAINEVFVKLCDQMDIPLTHVERETLLGRAEDFKKKEEIVYDNNELSRIDTISFNEAKDALFNLGEPLKAKELIAPLLSRYPTNIQIVNFKETLQGECDIQKIIRQAPSNNDKILAKYLAQIDYYTYTNLTSAANYISLAESLHKDSLLLQCRTVFYLYQKYLESNNKIFFDEIQTLASQIESKPATTKEERTWKTKVALLIENKSPIVNLSKEECEQRDIYYYLANKVGVTVSDSGNGQFKTINEAIRVCHDNSFVFLNSGYYTESLMPRQAVNILSYPDNKAVIDTTNCIFNYDVSLNNIYFMDTVSPVGMNSTVVKSLIEIMTNKATINNCNFESLPDTAILLTGPSMLADDSVLEINNCSFTRIIRQCVSLTKGKLIANNNHFTKGGTGIYVSQSSKADILNCEFYDCAYGISSDGKVNVDTCILKGNAKGISINNKAYGCVINNCDFNNMKYGYIQGNNSNAKLTNCRTSKNDCGFYIGQSSKATIENCDISSNYNVGLFGDNNSILTIKDSSMNSNGSFGYEGRGSSNVTFENCDVIGNNCGISLAKNAIATAKNCKFGESIKYSGVEVKENAKATLDKCEIYKNHSAGLVLFGNSITVANNCSFHENKSGVYGLNYSKVTLNNCTSDSNLNYAYTAADNADMKAESCSSSNSPSGFGFFKNSKAILNNCKVTNTLKYPGLQFSDNSLGTVTNCDVYNNNQNGILTTNNSRVTITDSKFHNNKSSGAHAKGISQALYDNCSFYNNAILGFSTSGNCEITVKNSSIYGNTSGFSFTEDSLPLVNNCKVFDNASYGIEVGLKVQPTIVNTSVYNNKKGKFLKQAEDEKWYRKDSLN